MFYISIQPNYIESNNIFGLDYNLIIFSLICLSDYLNLQFITKNIFFKNIITEKIKDCSKVYKVYKI